MKRTFLKRILPMFLLLIIIFSCFACKNPQNSTSSKNPQNSTSDEDENYGNATVVDEGLTYDQMIENLSTYNEPEELLDSYITFNDYVTIGSNATVNGKNFITLDAARIGFLNTNRPWFHYYYNDNKTSEILKVQGRYRTEFLRDNYDPNVGGPYPYKEFLYSMFSYAFDPVEGETFKYEHYLTNNDSRYSNSTYIRYSNATYISHGEQLVAKLFYIRTQKDITTQYIENFLNQYIRIIKNDTGVGYDIEKSNVSDILRNAGHKLRQTEEYEFSSLQELKDYNNQNSNLLAGKYFIIDNEEANYSYCENSYLISQFKGEKPFDKRGHFFFQDEAMYEYQLYSIPVEIQPDIPFTFKYYLHSFDDPYDGIDRKIIVIYQGETIVGIFDYYITSDSFGYSHFEEFLNNYLTVIN